MSAALTRYLIVAITLFAAASASARNGQIYFELAPGWGYFFTEDVETDANGAPPIEFTPQLKLGFNLFGWAGAELDLAGVFWDLDKQQRGGGGFVGGVFRLTPLEALTYAIPDDKMLPSLVPEGPVDWKNRPFDLGIYVGGGFHLIGEDIGYEGGYVKWGFDLKFYITPAFAIGLDFPFRHTLYKPFRYVNYQDRLVQCTPLLTPGGIADPVFREEEADCNGTPHSGVLFAPALTISGGFDFGV